MDCSGINCHFILFPQLGFLQIFGFIINSIGIIIIITNLSVLKLLFDSPYFSIANQAQKGPLYEFGSDLAWACYRTRNWHQFANSIRFQIPHPFILIIIPPKKKVFTSLHSGNYKTIIKISHSITYQQTI